MKNITETNIDELKNSISNIELKIEKIDTTLEKLFEILNSITVFIEENDESQAELEDEEDWTPYDERNFYSDDEEDPTEYYNDEEL